MSGDVQPGGELAGRYELRYVIDEVGDAPAGTWWRALDRDRGAEVALFVVDPEVVPGDPDGPDDDNSGGLLAELAHLGDADGEVAGVLDAGRAAHTVYVTATLGSPDGDWTGPLLVIAEKVAQILQGQRSEKALPFVSWKPASEQGAKKTPLIAAIDRPEMKPKIRPVSSSRAATAQPAAQPGSLGHYAPPRGAPTKSHRTWPRIAAAAAASAAVTVVVTVAIYKGASDSPRAASEAAASRPCPAKLLRVDATGPVYCIEPYLAPGQGQAPRVDVTLAQAREACRARSLRLCTVAEWEHACRGDLGVRDMSGSVAEWTAGGAIRGGSGDSQSRCTRSEQRQGTDQGYGDVGFRCCADPLTR